MQKAMKAAPGVSLHMKITRAATGEVEEHTVDGRIHGKHARGGESKWRMFIRKLVRNK